MNQGWVVGGQIVIHVVREFTTQRILWLVAKRWRGGDFARAAVAAVAADSALH